jgi:hypothetical protein
MSCSETKHDGRTARGPESFVSARVQEQRRQQWTSLLGSSPGKNSFCNTKTKLNRRMASRPRLRVSAGDYGNKGHPKTVLGSSPGTNSFCSSETKQNKRMAQRVFFSFGEEIRGTTVTITKTVSWFRVLVKVFSILNTNCGRWLFEDKWTKGDRTTVTISELFFPRFPLNYVFRQYFRFIFKAQHDRNHNSNRIWKRRNCIYSQNTTNIRTSHNPFKNFCVSLNYVSIWQ